MINIKINGKCKCGCDDKKIIFQLKSKSFTIDWFTDCGEWFLYFYLGKKYYRFSSCGFLKGRKL